MTPSEVAQHAASLRRFATERELRILDAVEIAGSQRQAAIALGMNAGTMRQFLRALGKRAARRGWSPEHDMTKVVPEPFAIKGTSTLYGPEGEVKLQWVKTREDALLAQQMMHEAAEVLAATLPRLAPTAAPDRTASALLVSTILWYRLNPST